MLRPFPALDDDELPFEKVDFFPLEPKSPPPPEEEELLSWLEVVRREREFPAPPSRVGGVMCEEEEGWETSWKPESEVG